MRPDDPTVRLRTGGGPGRALLRALVALLSAVVLLLTGYGWSVYRHVTGSLATSDVLDGAGPADGATDILLVGLDSRTDARGNPLPRAELDALDAGPDTGELDTDTLILVRIPNDPAAPSTAVSIPRDSYVSIPGFGTHKINSAYARGAAAARSRLQARGMTGADLDTQSRQEGRRTLITTVEQLTGASVDHFAELNLVGFAQITQTIGGVPVCLRAAVHDTYSGADFPAGPQVLAGPPALAFVRQRHGLPRGDLDRVVRQQAFLAGLTHKVLSAGTLADPGTLSKLVDVVGRYVVLDQGWDLLAFAAQAQGLTGGNISFRTVPTGRTDLPTPADGLAVQVEPSLVRAFVTDLAAPGRAVPTPPAATAPTVVDVLNGTGRTGLASRVADVLDDGGFAPGRIGNTDRAQRSVVRAAPAALDAARTAAEALGGLPVEADDATPAGRIEVVVGQDYTGPTTSRAPATRTATTGTAAATPTPPAGPQITAGGTPCVD